MKKLRIGLRLLLLLVALAAVCFATAGTLIKLHRAKGYPHQLGFETRLDLLEIQHRTLLKQLDDPEEGEFARRKLQRTEAAIAETRAILDKMAD